MEDRDTLRKLQTAFAHSTPDLLDSILSQCADRDTKKREEETQTIGMTEISTTQPVQRKQKKRHYRAFGLAAACLLVVVGLFGFNQKYSVDSIVELDVNPSIELQVSKSERIVEAVALNEDAAIILGDMDLAGIDLDVAVNAIVGSMVKNGYINEVKNSVLVSVENKNAAKGAALQEKVSAAIDDILKGFSVEGAVVSQTITADQQLQALADQYGISIGKATLIQKIVAQDPTKTFESLVGASINELNLLAEAKGTEGVAKKGSASKEAYIGETAAKAAALKHAGLSEASVQFTEVRLDYDDGRVVYEIEFYQGATEYDYEIDAVSGQVLEYDRDLNDDGRAAELPAQKTPPAAAAPSASAADNIGEAAAKAAALKHAGLTESQVVFTKVKFDYDDGRAEYEIDFVSGTLEYDYEIDAKTGAVLDWERDTLDDDDWEAFAGNPAAGAGAEQTLQPPQSNPTTAVGETKAKEIALSHAGLAEANAVFDKIELDRDDGRSLYKVEFRSGGREYEYEIDAVTGEILEYSSEEDD